MDKSPRLARAGMTMSLMFPTCFSSTDGAGAMSSNNSFFGDLLTTIADRGRALLDRSGRTTGATRAATWWTAAKNCSRGAGKPRALPRS